MMSCEKKDIGDIYGERTPLVPVMLMQWKHKHELLVFPWINFNAVWIFTTVTINFTCLLSIVEICCEMPILQQVEIIIIFMPYFRSIVTVTVWLLHKYEAHMYQGVFNMFPQFTSKEWPYRYQICEFVTAIEGECRIIIELCEHFKLCFVVILALNTENLHNKSCYHIALYHVNTESYATIIKWLNNVKYLQEER